MLNPIFSIRVTHNGLYADGRPNVTSVLINDLDTGQRSQNQKVPVYVPAGGSIDIPLTSNSLFSVNQGTISKLVEAGLVTAEVISPSGTGTIAIQIVNGKSTTAFENGTWEYPWKTIQKGINAIWGDPDDAFPASPSVAERGSKVVLVQGGTYDEDLVFPYAGSIKISGLAMTALGSTTAPRSISRVCDPAYNLIAPFVPVTHFESVIVWGGVTIADVGAGQSQNFVMWQGGVVDNFDASGQTGTFGLGLEKCFIGSPVFDAPTARMEVADTTFWGGAPNIIRLNICHDVNFTTGFTVADDAQTVHITSTQIDGTVTSPVNLRMDYFTNGTLVTNAVVKVGGWSSIPIGSVVPY